MNDQVNNQLEYSDPVTVLAATRAAVAAHLTPVTAAAAALSRDPFARAHGRAALRFHLSLGALPRGDRRRHARSRRAPS